MILLNRHNLAAAAFCREPGDRPCLEGVYVTTQATIATDGTLLLRVDAPARSELHEPPGLRVVPAEHADNANADVPAIVPVEACKTVGHFIPASREGGRQAVALEPSTDNRVRFSTRRGDSIFHLEIATLPGPYPGVETCFPTTPPSGRVFLDSQKLRALADYFVKHCQPTTLEIEFRETHDPVVIRGRTDENQQVIALLMPRATL